MPRRPRLKLAAVPLHIIQRGNNRGACFFTEDDYQFYLYHLGQACKKHEVNLHAYILMTNHVHLLVTPELAESIPRLIIALGRRYVQYINVTYRRTGTLWDSRYKSPLIQTEPYLLSCQRYIELNPVHAAMVDDPAHYPWSSYRHHGLGQDNPYLSPHPLSSVIETPSQRGDNYPDRGGGCHSSRTNHWAIHASMQRSKP